MNTALMITLQNSGNMNDIQLEKLKSEQRKTLKTGESAVTIHHLECGGVFLTVIDEHSFQLIAFTVGELEQLKKLLK